MRYSSAAGLRPAEDRSLTIEYVAPTCCQLSAYGVAKRDPDLLTPYARQHESTIVGERKKMRLEC